MADVVPAVGVGAVDALGVEAIDHLGEGIVERVGHRADARPCSDLVEALG